jgi:hypothetical protein
MSSSLDTVGFDQSTGPEESGLVRLTTERQPLSLAEEVAVREAESIGGLDYVFFVASLTNDHRKLPPT